MNKLDKKKAPIVMRAQEASITHDYFVLNFILLQVTLRVGHTLYIVIVYVILTEWYFILYGCMLYDCTMRISPNMGH